MIILLLLLLLFLLNVITGTANIKSVPPYPTTTPKFIITLQYILVDSILKMNQNRIYDAHKFSGVTPPDHHFLL